MSCETITFGSVLSAATAAHACVWPPPPHQIGLVNSAAVGEHTCALVLAGASAAAVGAAISRTAQHAVVPPLPCARSTSAVVGSTALSVGASVGAAAAGNTASENGGSGGPQLSKSSQSSHSILTTPSPGALSHAASTGTVMIVGDRGTATPTSFVAVFPVWVSHAADAWPTWHSMSGFHLATPGSDISIATSTLVGVVDTTVGAPVNAGGSTSRMTFARFSHVLPRFPAASTTAAHTRIAPEARTMRSRSSKRRAPTHVRR